MRAGDLRHKVSVQQRATGQDTFGGQAADWTEVAQVWARIQPLNGRELMAAAAVQSETTHSIVVRYHPVFSKPGDADKLRIVCHNRIFNITASINEDERNRMVTLAATEGLNDG